MVTETYKRSEAKYGDSKMIRSSTSFIMATNDAGIVPGDAQDKRHVVMESRETYAGNDAFFKQFSERLAANYDAGHKCIGHILLKTWTISDSFGSSGQNPPLTRMMLLQKRNNFSHEQAFLYSVLDRGYFVEPEDLSDYKPLTRDHIVDQYNIWRFDASCGPRWKNTFSGQNRMKQTALRMVNDKQHNLFHKGRIDASCLKEESLAYLNERRGRKWQRFIMVDDVMTAFRNWKIANDITPNRWSKADSMSSLVACMRATLWDPNDEALKQMPETDQVPTIVLTQVWARPVRSTKKSAVENVPLEPIKRNNVKYFYLPPLAMCVNRFNAKIGELINGPDLNESLDTSIAEEQEDIRKYLATSMVRDANSAFDARAFPFNLPKLEALDVNGLNANGFRPRPKKRSYDDAFLGPNLNDPAVQPTTAQMLERAQKKRRLEELQEKEKEPLPLPSLPPPQTSTPDVIPIRDDDDYASTPEFAFLFETPSPIDQEVDLYLANEVPCVVQPSNTNVIVPAMNMEFEDLFEFNNPFGDEMFLY